MTQSMNGQDADVPFAEIYAEEIAAVEFNKITTGMLMAYETELLTKTVQGAVNRLARDVSVAIKVGWIGEPFDGFTSGAWEKEEPDPARIHLLKIIDVAIDEKYSSFVTIDPNG